MADYVELTPDGMFCYDWNGDEQGYDREPAQEDRILTYLRSECRISDGTRIGDIFRIVESFSMLKEFLRQYSWCWKIDELHAQAFEPMRSGECEIEWLEVSAYTECWDFRGDKSFSLCIDFGGVGPAAPEFPEGNRDDGRQSYSASCTPLYDLFDLPVKLDTRIKIRTPLGGGEPTSLLFAGDYCFSLLEVLDAIYDDISFYGGPDEKQEFIEDMMERKRQYEDGEIEAAPLRLDDEDAPDAPDTK